MGQWEDRRREGFWGAKDSSARGWLLQGKSTLLECPCLRLSHLGNPPALVEH